MIALLNSWFMVLYLYLCLKNNINDTAGTFAKNPTPVTQPSPQFAQLGPLFSRSTDDDNVGFNDNYDSNDGILMKKITEKDTNIMTFE